MPRADRPLRSRGRGLALLQPASRRRRPPNFQKLHIRLHLRAQGGLTTFWNLRKPRRAARRTGRRFGVRPAPRSSEEAAPRARRAAALKFPAAPLCDGRPLTPVSPSPTGSPALGPSPAHCARFWKPRDPPRLGRGRGHLRPAPGQLPVPAPRSRGRPPASVRCVPLLHARRRPGLRSAQDARDPNAPRLAARSAAPRPPGVRAGAESRLGPRGASYPRACRRQAGPEGSAPGFN